MSEAAMTFTHTVRPTKDTHDFCQWLYGYLELAEPQVIDAKVTARIKEELAAMFTPSWTMSAPEAQP